jgi:hypothetical protein
MLKIVVGGQIYKAEIAKLIEKLSPNKFEISVKNDLDAAMDLKNSAVDYYIGACNTGGGGALAMALALAGADKCATISMPGNILSDEKIIAEVEKGKKAFGFTGSDYEKVVPILIVAIIKKIEG